MKKNNSMSLAAIYETINIESFEQLGYEVISKDKMQINFGKTVEIDEKNSIYVSLSFQHPIFTILSKDFQINKIMESLGESLFEDDKPKLTTEEKLKKRIKRALPGMAQSIIHKENHNNELSFSEQVAMRIGSYSGRSMAITDDEARLVKEWNPLAGKIVEFYESNKAMDVYRNYEFSDEEWEKEGPIYDKLWDRYKSLEKEIVEEIYELFTFLEKKGIKLEVEGSLVKGFKFKEQ